MDAEAVQAMARTFGVNWPHFLAQLASFGVVCAVLYTLAYTPILRMLDARRQQIASGLANAEKIREQLARVEVERRDVLLQADAEGKRLVGEARAAAARVLELESRNAKALAEQIKARAHEDGVRERTRLLEDLKREVGRLVVQTTAAVTAKVLSADDHRRLAEETAQYLASYDPTHPMPNGARELHPDGLAG